MILFNESDKVMHEIGQTHDSPNTQVIKLEEHEYIVGVSGELWKKEEHQIVKF